MQATHAPPGAYVPGTKLTVGSHQIVIKSYISEGGFAHVYTCQSDPPDAAGNPIACLKRVAVPDKVHLNLLRAEVDAMKRLKGHPNIVRYMDSHAARLADGNGYEVFLLMEYCSNHGLIDFMNTRLREQLSEPEILKIMYDVTNGLACMHYLQPALIHRDLKIENVLISADGTYKLCDFGSASPVLRQPRNTTEFHILDEDIQRHTTPQYRSPEMIDIYRGFPIDEKSDIWALGVFLYKLCYYTTPFEREGQLAILHARYVFPDRPPYSDRLKRVISAMLREDPRNRPNVYQVLKEVSSMRGVEVPIKDIYTAAVKKLQEQQRAQEQQLQRQQQQQQQQRPQSLAVSKASAQTTHSARDFSPVETGPEPATPGIRPVTAPQPARAAVDVPDIKPMHRGRPQVKEPVPLPTMEAVADRLQAYSDNGGGYNSSEESAQPSKSSSQRGAAFSDPFALLDAKSNASQYPEGATTPNGRDQQVSLSVRAATPEPAAALVSHDYDEAYAKYPTVEELTRSLETQTFSFESPPKSRPVSAAGRSGHVPVTASSGRKNTPPSGGNSLSSYGKQQLSTDGKRYASSSSSSSDEEELRDAKFDIPKVSVSPPLYPQDGERKMAPPPLPKRKPGALTGKPVQRPVSLYISSTGSLIDNDDVPRSTQNSQSPEPNLLDSVPSDDREELKKILTGLSQRSSTIVLEDESNHIDSNVDFLRTLDGEKDASALNRKSSGTHHHSRKPSHSGLTAGSDSWKIRRSGSATSSRHTKRPSMSSLKGIINDAFNFSGGNGARSPSTEPPPAANARRASGERERKVSPNMRGLSGRFSYSSESLTDFQHPANEKEVVPGRISFDQAEAPRRKVPIARPHTSSAIQSRVQAFLKRTESPPPRKTAQGYGKFTDGAESTNSGNAGGSGSSDSDSRSEERTISSVETISVPPRKPSRPQLAQSGYGPAHAHESSETRSPRVSGELHRSKSIGEPPRSSNGGRGHNAARGLAIQGDREDKYSGAAADKSHTPTLPSPVAATFGYHGRKLSTISSGSSNGSQAPPRVPSKPSHLRSPRRSTTGFGPDVPAKARVKSGGDSEWDSRVDQFNRKYPSLG